MPLPIEMSNPESHDFVAEMRRAEAEAGVDAWPEDYDKFLEGGEVRERDSRGRFVSAESHETSGEAGTSALEHEQSPTEAAPATETSAEEGQEQPEEEQEGRLLADKYRSTEELEASYRELQGVLGRQGNELSEARNQIAQLSALFTQAQAGASRSAAPSIAELEMRMESAPEQASQIAARAAQDALAGGDELTYEGVISLWGQYDQFGALRYDQRVQSWKMQHQLMDELSPQLDSARKLTQRSLGAEALEMVRARHEDFDTHVAGITAQELEGLERSGFPADVLRGLASDDQAKQVSFFEMLYRWRKADNADRMGQARASASEQSKEESRQKKREATVASSTRQAPSAEPAASEAERMWKTWTEQTTMQDGWEGRDTRTR